MKGLNKPETNKIDLKTIDIWRAGNNSICFKLPVVRLLKATV
jgi:hypothetical protein